MKKKIIIIGGKGTAVVIAEQVIDAIERFNYNAELIGFAFDDPEMTTVLDYPILCHSYEVMEKYGKDDMRNVMHSSDSKNRKIIEKNIYLK